MRDEDVRTACMARLSLLVAEFGEDIPYAGALANGFPFRGSRVPFLNYQKGIYRACSEGPRRSRSRPLRSHRTTTKSSPMVSFTPIEPATSTNQTTAHSAQPH